MQIISGTIDSVMKLQTLNNKWMQKKESGDLILNRKEANERAGMTQEERMVEEYEEQAQEDRETRSRMSVYNKVMSGGTLTPEEEEYLKKESPTTLDKYRRMKLEKKEYEQKLRDCRTKDEVKRLKTLTMGEYSASLKKVVNDPYIPKSEKYAKAQEMIARTRNIQNAETKFIQSGAYAELPEEEEVQAHKIKEEKDMVNTDVKQTNRYQDYTSKATEYSSTSEVTDYGKTVGEPKLSEEGKKYYEELKKKYSNYDFVLVSEDQKANAQANAAQYANNFKTVVLIDEDKIEKMATDENYRKKYESILSGAQSQLSQLKSSMESSGANVKGYGMQVNDGGNASFFAVLKKSTQAQKERIEKNAENKKAQRKEDEKKAARKEKEEKLKEAQSDEDIKAGADDEDTITISAGSIEELMKKIDDYYFTERSNYVQTDSEKALGQNIDFRG